MTYKEFLEGPIKVQIRAIGLGINYKCSSCCKEGVTNSLPYHAFALDAIAIEFIGKISRCNNSEEIIKGSKSEDDFTNAIRNYFPLKYRPYSEFLYTNLRCGMTHFFGAKNGISLTWKEGDNLKVLDNGDLVLVFEDFHKDLCLAIDKLIKENKPLLQEKFLDIR